MIRVDDDLGPTDFALLVSVHDAVVVFGLDARNVWLHRTWHLLLVLPLIAALIYLL